MNNVHIGYLRSGLQLTLGKVFYVQETRAVHVDWGTVQTYFDIIGYASNEAEARQLLGIRKRKEQCVFARWGRSDTHFLNHQEGTSLRKKKCKTKQST